jgi:Cd(II)/Pb(II)-responsive transcriptional regulator
MAAGMKIGELAKATDCTVETIRYYEREGLLPVPERTVGNYRVYGPMHAEALSFIRHCRSLDMTQSEIRALLLLRNAPDRRCGEVNALLDEHIGHVANRIRELRALERELKGIRARCRSESTTRECEIMLTLAENAEQSRRTGGEHGDLGRTHRSRP